MADDKYGKKLLKACQTKNISAVKKYLKKGDVNYADCMGHTPFSVACGLQFEKGIELLIQNDKVNFNHKDDIGLRAVDVLIMYQDYDTLEKIVRNTAFDINEKNKNGECFAQSVMCCKHIGLLSALLDHSDLDESIMIEDVSIKDILLSGLKMLGYDVKATAITKSAKKV